MVLIFGLLIGLSSTSDKKKKVGEILLRLGPPPPFQSLNYVKGLVFLSLLNWKERNIIGIK